MRSREIQASNYANAVDRVLQPLDGFTSAASGVQYVHSLLEAKGRNCGQELRSREFVEAPKLRGVVPPRRIVKKISSSGFCVRHRREAVTAYASVSVAVSRLLQSLRVGVHTTVVGTRYPNIFARS
jgi:hypothetical protein